MVQLVFLGKWCYADVQNPETWFYLLIPSTTILKITVMENLEQKGNSVSTLQVKGGLFKLG